MARSCTHVFVKLFIWRLRSTSPLRGYQLQQPRCSTSLPPHVLSCFNTTGIMSYVVILAELRWTIRANHFNYARQHVMSNNLNNSLSKIKQTHGRDFSTRRTHLATALTRGSTRLAIVEANLWATAHSYGTHTISIRYCSTKQRDSTSTSASP